MCPSDQPNAVERRVMKCEGRETRIRVGASFERSKGGASPLGAQSNAQDRYCSTASGTWLKCLCLCSTGCNLARGETSVGGGGVDSFQASPEAAAFDLLTSSLHSLYGPTYETARASATCSVLGVPCSRSLARNCPRASQPHPSSPPRQGRHDLDTGHRRRARVLQRAKARSCAHL